MKRSFYLITSAFLFSFNLFAQIDGLVGHWTLDETSGIIASDQSSGHKFSGTLTGGTWQPSSGKIGGALAFNGSSDFVDIGATAGSYSSLSVAFWFKASSVKHQIPIDKLPAQGTAGWSVKLRSNGEIWIRIGSEANHSDMIILNGYTPNTWTHLTFSYENGLLSVYLNGVIKGTKSDIIQTVANTNTPLRLGVSSANGGEKFGGLMDEVRIYDRVLDYGEIMDMNGITPQENHEIGDLTLWYNTESGNEFTNALPIGNGSMGGMVYGNVVNDKIGLNEATVWSGNPGNNNKPGAANYLAEARNKVFSGDYFGADQVVSNMISSGNQAFQPVGDLLLNFAGHKAANYSRTLDLETAVAKVSYIHDGVTYTRTYFASYPDQTIVVKLTADQPNSISYSATMTTPHTPNAVSVEDGSVLVLDGTADAIKFQSRAQVTAVGGSVTTEMGKIIVTGANSSEIRLIIATNFNSYKDVGGNPAKRAKHAMTNAAIKTYENLFIDHKASYKELFNRVQFDPGTANSYSYYPTNERVALFNISNDPMLVRLYYQFGRYLLISCSRPGSQAANLQGIWNNLLSPPWGSNYTININTEMNYWMSETANLAECALPLIDKVQNMESQGKLTAKMHWGVDKGWVAHHQSDLWNHTAPMDGPWGFWPSGGAWLSMHLWEHYQFDPKSAYLAHVYPTMKSAAEFFLASMVTENVTGNNYLVTCPSASPENMHNGGANVSFAPTMDIQIIRDLFNATGKAAEILKTDSEFRAEIATAIAKLPPNKIGKHGQLQEWYYDWDNPNDNHRHVSHLYAAFPGSDITMEETPELANAIRTTLNQRGDLSTGWSLAWKINLWARLLDGNRSYDLISLLITPERTYNNLFDAHPPFQIDGNFGAVSGINELFVQSHHNKVELLPALPSIWPSGSMNGLRARGGFIVDSLKWQDGKLVSVTVTSTVGGVCLLKYGALEKQFETLARTKYVLNLSLEIIDHISVTMLPVITSGTIVSATVGVDFEYTITGSNNPTSFGAENLPPGLFIDSATGIISGVPSSEGSFLAEISASNEEGKTSHNLAFMIDTSLVVTVPQSPYGGTPWPVPGLIEAEDFDLGGQGVSYSDSDASNNGGQYRLDDHVDIENCGEGGYNVGFVSSGEWLKYTVNVVEAGNYTLELRVATQIEGGSAIQVLFDAVDKTGTIVVPNTGGWQAFQTVSVDIVLAAGEQEMQLWMAGGSFNINYINIKTTEVLKPDVLSVVNRNVREMLVYPNPLNSTSLAVEYRGLGNEKADLLIFDLVGKLLIQKAMISEKMEVSRDFFKPGVYLLKIESSKGVVTSSVIIE